MLVSTPPTAEVSVRPLGNDRTGRWRQHDIIRRMSPMQEVRAGRRQTEAGADAANPSPTSRRSRASVEPSAPAAAVPGDSDTGLAAGNTIEQNIADCGGWYQPVGTDRMVDTDKGIAVGPQRRMTWRRTGPGEQRGAAGKRINRPRCRGILDDELPDSSFLAMGPSDIEHCRTKPVKRTR